MPIQLICSVCGSPFTRKPAEVRKSTNNYCSRRCSTTANYSIGDINKGRRNSPSTEFARGDRAHNHLPIGSVRIRQRRNRTDAPRAWVKVAEPNVWVPRAIVVFEQANGPRTRGRIIHHINGDSLDDRPENLIELTRSEHVAVHADQLVSSRLS